jgi:hypothetical protein
MTAVAAVMRHARRFRKVWPLGIIAGAAAVVLPRLLKRRSRAVQPMQPRVPSMTEAAYSDRQTADTLALAVALVSARGAEAAVDQLACLERAADIVLGAGSVVGRAVVVAHRDAFLERCKADWHHTRRACAQCGATMAPTTSHDRDVDDWLLVWNCGRCGAQVPR